MDDASGTGGEDSDPAVLEAARDDVVTELVTFARSLRRAGISVPANAGIDAARALAEVGFDDERRVRAALRATLVADREDLATFDRLFREFWRRLDLTTDDPEPGIADDADLDGSLGLPGQTDPEPADGGGPAGAWTGDTTVGATDDLAAGDDAEVATYSPEGRAGAVDADGVAFDAETPVATAVGRLTDALATLPGRRWQGSGSDRPDLRGALRRSVGTGGTVVSVPERERSPAAVRGVVLVDVSRSVLDALDRGFLLRFLHAVVASWRTSRVLLFDDDVREVTDALAEPTVEASVAALAHAEAEWGGGTRIGDAVQTLRSDHPDAVDHRSVVLVVSDGLEMGDVSDLESGMAWLSGRAGTVLWLNPLAASPDYQPTARGMAAARPHLDGLFAFTSADDVDEIARQIGRYGVGGQVGFRHDPRR